jgi:hypothetical protein
VTGGVADCPYTWDNSRLAGTVTIGGFNPGASYPVEWTTFDANGSPSVQATVNRAADGGGNIVLELDQLPATAVDAAVKVGTRSSTPSLPAAPRNLRITPGVVQP